MAENSIAQLSQILESLGRAMTTVETQLFERLKQGESKVALNHEVEDLNSRIRALASRAHEIQFKFDWETPPQPEWFDHYLDQYYGWHSSRIPFWLERGIFNLLALKEQSVALELCCGDGFNAYHFYSIRCKQITATDFDPEVLSHAIKFNQAPNVGYELCDVRSNFPHGSYDNIIWDAAIEHFTPAEIDALLRNIKSSLKPGGILSGYTICEQPSGEKSLSHHEYEFKSKEDLARFFTSHFANVKVFETKYPTRHNLYFYCSDANVPFDQTWDSVVQDKHR